MSAVGASLRESEEVTALERSSAGVDFVALRNSATLECRKKRSTIENLVAIFASDNFQSHCFVLSDVKMTTFEREYHMLPRKT